MSNKSVKDFTGARKRTQIEAANKTVFMWTVIAAAALSLCAVVGYFLIKEIAFNGKILSAKAETLTTLNQNIEAADELRQNVQSLIANNDLAKVKADDSDSNYKVVLDALPVTNDSTVLGASLIQELLPKSGVTVENLSTEASDGTAVAAAPEALPEDDAMLDPTAETGSTSELSGVSALTFNFTVNGNYDQLRNMLRDLELSIRPMNVTSVTIQGSGDTLQAVVQGQSYHSSERSVQLGTEPISP